jgi:hypothetical protein
MAVHLSGLLLGFSLDYLGHGPRAMNQQGALISIVLALISAPQLPA